MDYTLNTANRTETLHIEFVTISFDQTPRITSEALATHMLVKTDLPGNFSGPVSMTSPLGEYLLENIVK